MEENNNIKTKYKVINRDYQRSLNRHTADYRDKVKHNTVIKRFTHVEGH